jgi:hypothetical protein
MMGLLAVLLVSGCTATTGGTARPAPSATAGSLTGPTIKQVMLDGAALSKLLNQPFKTVPPFPPHFGAGDQLVDSYGSPSPAECEGIVFMLQKNTYQSASGKSDVRSFATEGWAHDGTSVKVDIVVEGVVSLPTAEDAAALFARFSAQWKECDGQTLTVPSDIFPDNPIADVRVADSVVAATVSRGAGAHSILLPEPEARAIGARGNCLVEVEVTFFGNSYPSDEGSADINTSAIDIAHAMMDKVSALS